MEYLVLGDDGIVKEIVELTDEEFMSSNKILLQRTGNPLPQVGWIYNGAGLVPPSPPVVDKQYLIENVIDPTIKKLNALIVEFAAENVLMGITQLGKTKAVSDYLKDVQRYASAGSATEVKNEIDRLIAAGIPGDLSPFVTEERLISFKSKI